MAGEKNFENRLKEWLEAEGIYPLGEPVPHHVPEPSGAKQHRRNGREH